MFHALAASGQVPKIPADWPGWLTLAVLALIVATALRKWMRS
jgi:hypothetical protein